MRETLSGVVIRVLVYYLKDLICLNPHSTILLSTQLSLSHGVVVRKKWRRGRSGLSPHWGEKWAYKCQNTLGAGTLNAVCRLWKAESVCGWEKYRKETAPSFPYTDLITEHVCVSFCKKCRRKRLNTLFSPATLILPLHPCEKE